MLPARQLLENYARLQDDLSEACRRSSRKLSDIKLVAVSKFHPPEAIQAVFQEGQLDFGENYIQEWHKKREILGKQNPGLRWHLLGRLQTRKAALAAGNFALIHTVDSEKLAAELEKRLIPKNEAPDIEQDILIEVNIGGEPQKSGVPIAEAARLGEFILASCPHLKLAGLMCLPPVFDAGEASRPWFARLYELRESLAKTLGLPLKELSMGMSGDFAAAISEGATIVRIGAAIFGPRMSGGQLAKV